MLALNVFASGSFIAVDWWPMAAFLDSLGARLLQTRSFVRAPIWLYRHRMGRLLGQRIFMLEHTSRQSGQPRYACLEVVERPTPDVIVVASGFGTHAQWYRNLQAQPECRVSIGRLIEVPARARMMPPSESEETLQRYQQAHPGAWRRLRGAIEAAARTSVADLPMVELTLHPHP